MGFLFYFPNNRLQCLQFILIYLGSQIVLIDHPSVCVALGDPECEMSEFICNYTIAFTAAWNYGQFLAQALI